MKLTIGIPLYITNDLHLDFTRQTLESIQTKYEKSILLVSNYIKEDLTEQVNELAKEYDAVLFTNPVGNSVSAAWNIAIREALKDKNNKYILLPNNDIVFHKDAIDNLVKFAEEHSEYALWTANTWNDLRTLKMAELDDGSDEHPHFSCFMIPTSLITELSDKEHGTGEPYPGLFDENYRAAYFEDNDMHNRILRAKMKAAKTASSVFYHYGSRTIKTDDELFLHNRVTYQINRDYFKKKWGFDPHDAAIANDSKIRFKYKKPFNK